MFKASFLFICISILAFSCDQPVNPYILYSIEGNVALANSECNFTPPYDSILVTLWGSNISLYTDSLGNFKFNNVPSSRYDKTRYLRFTKVGYAPKDVEIFLDHNDVDNTVLYALDESNDLDAFNCELYKLSNNTDLIRFIYYLKNDNTTEKTTNLITYVSNSPEVSSTNYTYYFIIDSYRNGRDFQMSASLNYFCQNSKSEPGSLIYMRSYVIYGCTSSFERKKIGDDYKMVITNLGKPSNVISLKIPG